MEVNQPVTPPSAGLEAAIFGSDLDGFPIMERSRVLSLTQDGGIIELNKKLAPESEVIVSNPATHKEAMARVVGLIREDAQVHVYGIVFLDPSVSLWDIELPAPQPRKQMVLACSRCQTVELVSLSDIEAQIFQTNQSLTRHCKCGNSSTVWKFTDRRVGERRESSRENSDAPETERRTADRRKASSAAAPQAASGKDKRREKRTAVKCSACIRFSGRDAIGECEDLSRGGFRFKSRIFYPIGTQIEAAVPYVKGGMNIFVACKIVYAAELPDGMNRHGVSYVKSISKS